MRDGQTRNETVLVTGCAGFLGSHLCERLIAMGRSVVGVDCFSPYYPRELKERNLAALRADSDFRFVELDLAVDPLEDALEGVEVVFHLAGQPGVRPSFGEGFADYLRHNVHGTQRLLEGVAGTDLRAFVYASSSSVYGDQVAYPVCEDAPVRPVSPYGATKVITEQLANAFWRSHGVPSVGMRYFTVYGPRQRPDMAFSRFLASSLAGEPLTVLGDGRQVREFTYVRDVVQATIAAADRGERGSVYNVGGGEAVALLEAIGLLGELLGAPLAVEHAEAAPGDPRRTDADIGRARRDLGYEPTTGLREGLTAQLDSLRARRGGGPAAVRRPAARPEGPHVLAYSHDGYGLGHMRRNLRLMTGLRRRRPDVEVTLVTGAKDADRLVHGRGIGCVPLPAVVKVANGRYVPEDPLSPIGDVLRARAELIASTVRDLRPDLLLVDRYPRGLHDELVPALDAYAELCPDAPAVLGLRDILDDPRVVREEWAAGGYTPAILETYDTVLCYGDPRVFDPAEEYGLPPEVRRRIRFTGYLADELLAGDASEVRAAHRADGGRLAVCTLGGGRDAAPIAMEFLSAMERLRPSGWSAVLITGPYMTTADRRRLAAHPAAGPVTVLPMVEDLPSYLAAADVVVSMGGYNTTCELLALGVRAVMIPRVSPRQEQLMRVERLGRRGLVSWLHPSRLSPAALADLIEQGAADAASHPVEGLERIGRRGVETAVRHIAALLPAESAQAPVQARDARRAEVAGAWG